MDAEDVQSPFQQQSCRHMPPDLAQQAMVNTHVPVQSSACCCVVGLLAQSLFTWMLSVRSSLKIGALLCRASRPNQPSLPLPATLRTTSTTRSPATHRIPCRKCKRSPACIWCIGQVHACKAGNAILRKAKENVWNKENLKKLS